MSHWDKDMDEPRHRRKPVRVGKEEERQRILGLVAGPRRSSGIPSLQLALDPISYQIPGRACRCLAPNLDSNVRGGQECSRVGGRVIVPTWLQERGFRCSLHFFRASSGVHVESQAPAQSPFPSPCFGCGPFL